MKKDDPLREEEAKRKKHHILFAHHWRIEWLIGTLKALPLPF